jgi:hypothetical protein
MLSAYAKFFCGLHGRNFEQARHKLQYCGREPALAMEGTASTIA